MVKIEGVHSIGELGNVLVKLLEEKGVLESITKNTEKEALKARVKKQKVSTLREISASGIWGDLTKNGVRARLKNLKDHEYYLQGNKTVVLRSAILREEASNN